MTTASPPNRAPLTAALVAMLATVTARPVGDGEPPANTTMPYSIVEEIPGGGLSGPPMFAPDADGAFAYQIRCVGGRRDQTGALADRVRQAILGRTVDGLWANAITVAGLAVIDREQQSIGGIDREGTVFNAVDGYLLTVSPT